MAVCCEKATAMLPEPRPDAFAIRLRQLQTADGVASEKLKPPFAMHRRHGHQPRFHLEQKHQPVRVTLKAVLADDASQVQIARLDLQRDFLHRLTAGASVGRFAVLGVQLAAGRAPAAAIRLLRAFQQQHFVAFVEAIEQGGDFVGQRHGGSEAGARGWNQD